jgi:hypothetical protein
MCVWDACWRFSYNTSWGEHLWGGVGFYRVYYMPMFGARLPQPECTEVHSVCKVEVEGVFPLFYPLLSPWPWVSLGLEVNRVSWPCGIPEQSNQNPEKGISVLCKGLVLAAKGKLVYCHTMGVRRTLFGTTGSPRHILALLCAVVMINGKLCQLNKDKTNRTQISQEWRVGSPPLGSKSHPAKEAKENMHWVWWGRATMITNLGLCPAPKLWVIAAKLYVWFPPPPQLPCMNSAGGDSIFRFY